MKKILLIIAFCVAGLTGYAECFYTRAYANKNNITQQWSEWTDCRVLVCFNQGSLVIYSQKPQVYDVVDFEDVSINGEIVYLYYCYDQDRLRCVLRFRQYVDDNTIQTQLYVEYKDVMWVYNLTQDA